VGVRYDGLGAVQA